jgi:hypothetical protein
MGMNDRIAVLVGNGMSIAFNSKLELTELTNALVEKIASFATDGSAAIEVLNSLVSASPDAHTFETFVGALEESNISSQALLKLAMNLSPDEKALHDSIINTSDFARTLRDWGVSFVLETIMERSRIAREDRGELDSLLIKLKTSFSAQLVFGNLNYDTMLLTAMLQTYGLPNVADMASGYENARVISDNQEITVRALRRTDDFPKNRVLHLSLHGSLQFWSDDRRKTVVKLETAMLEDGDQWRSVREGTTNIRPVVVLTNQKQKVDAVRDFPFSLAYEKFEQALVESTKWLIIGYSFTDRSVNDMLRVQKIFNSGCPEIFVVTLGSSPSRKTIEKVFGWDRQVDGSSRKWLTIYRGGARKFASSKMLEKICDTPGELEVSATG